MDKSTPKISKSGERDFFSPIIAEDDELLRHLHILDTLAYESLDAQLKFIEKVLLYPLKHSNNIQKKCDAARKYLWFDDAKRSFLKSNGFIDISNMIGISNKKDVHNIICRCNMTLFFNMLFANFDPDVPDLPNVNYQAFFDHVVPPTLAQSEEIWDLGLKLRVQVYNYKMYKNPQKDMISAMFPNEVEGPPIYKETYKKIRNKIKQCSGDVDTLMKEFKWGKFAKEMYKLLFKIADSLDKPVLYKYTSGNASPMPSSTGIVDEGASRRKDVGNSIDEQDQDVSSDNLGDSSSKNDKNNEIAQMISFIDINDHTCLNNQTVESVVDARDVIIQASSESRSSTQSDLSSNGASENSEEPKNDESCASDLGERDRTSNSLLPEQHADDRQTSPSDSSVEEISFYEQIEDNSSKKRSIDPDNDDEIKRMRKKVKVMWNKQELLALEEGMRQHGKSWSIIKRHFGNTGQPLENRNQMQLKDKARSEFNRRIRDGIEPGVFGIMEML